MIGIVCRNKGYALDQPGIRKRHLRPERVDGVVGYVLRLNNKRWQSERKNAQGNQDSLRHWSEIKLNF